MVYNKTKRIRTVEVMMSQQTCPDYHKKEKKQQLLVTSLHFPTSFYIWLRWRKISIPNWGNQ